jgi:glycosyltransferase involved in cell wall biosynthesis
LKKIIVSVSNDLTTDQRVHRTCLTLKELDFEVLLVGRKSPRIATPKRPYSCKQFGMIFNKGFLFYAEFNTRLFFFLLFQKKDILLANDLDTLLPNYLVSRFLKKPLVYDSHELFTEIPELIERPLVKRFWCFIEKVTVPNIKHAYTVSPSIAAYYSERYQTNFKVIRNLPFANHEKKAETGIDPKGRKILIYQGALNIGRGLELVLDTMTYLDNHLLLIIGSGDVEAQLLEKSRKLQLEDKVRFMGRMDPNELKKNTIQADLGFSLEEDLGLNYRFALPNKIFDYIQAEVPVIISDLPEMKDLMQHYTFGEIIIARNPKDLALQIESILLKDFKAPLKKAKKDLVWENEKQHLIAIFENLDC